MKNILIVSPTLRSQKTIRQLLADFKFKHIEAIESYGNAKRLLKQRRFDLLILNATLSHKEVCEFAKFIIKNSVMQVIVFSSHEQLEELRSELEPLGIFIVAKPINTKNFYNILKFCNISHNRTMEYLNQNKKLMTKLEDIKTINRAKCILIQTKHMTEDEAHKHLEKCAMDMRITKKAVADSIVAEYSGSSQ